MASSYLRQPILLILLLGYPFYSTCIFQNSRNLGKFAIQKTCDDAQRSRLINGQYNPLSQTLENFISLVEKFENANTELNLEDTIYLFLKNFTQENFVKEGKFVKRYIPSGMVTSNLDNAWDDPQRQLPNHINPYEVDEMCSLFYMLSHTVDDSPGWNEGEKEIYSMPKNGNLQAETFTKSPREVGSVYIRSTEDSVALGPVLMGLYFGLKPKNIQVRTFFEANDNGYELQNDNAELSLLHTLTLADALLFSKWEPFTKPTKIDSVGNGRFRDVFIGPPEKTIVRTDKLICPTIHYQPENATFFVTYSLIRGATDGLILGSKIQRIASATTGARLSQVLRSYYTRQGIVDPEQQNNSDDPKSFSICQRGELVDPLMIEVRQQMEYELAVLAQSYEKETYSTLLDQAKDQFIAKRDEIFKLKDGFCQLDLKPENRQSETPVDVVLVLDTNSNSDAEKKLQQEFAGYLASNLDLWAGGSTMSVYLGNADLQELVPQSNSSAEVACRVIQSDLITDTTERYLVIRAISNLLYEKKNNISELNGAPGIVVVYFNFEEQETETRELRDALGYLQSHHIDIPFYAVGRKEDVLKKYVGWNNQGIYAIIGDTDGVQKQSRNLVEKVSLGPSALQYKDCKLARNEPSTVYDGRVTRDSVQYWTMDTRFFEKSFNSKFFFEVEAGAGNIQVCHNRASRSEPGSVGGKCFQTPTDGRRLQFNYTDPCKGLSGSTCPPIRFSVAGLKAEPNSQNYYCGDRNCKSLNQVKFKFSHEGVRCSGCSSLLSTSSLLFVCLLLTYLFITKDK